MSVRTARLTLTGALCALLAIVGGGAFDDTQWALLAPVAVVTAAAFGVAGRRAAIRLPVMAAAVIGGVVVSTSLAGGSFGDAVDAFVGGPRQLLTTEWPSPTLPSVVGAVAALIGVTSALALDVAGRGRWHLAPLGLIAAGWAAAMAIGAPVRPPVWVLLLGGSLAFTLALTRQRDNGSRWSPLSLLDRTVIVSVVSISLIGVGTASAIAWTDRADPRQTEDADVSASILDPIEATVALRRADPSVAMFEIADRSRVVGQSFPARWRVAALDEYDGQRWVPRLTLRPIGGQLGLPAPDGVDRPPAIDYELTYLSDDTDLVPFPGPPLSVSVDVATDVDRVVVRTLERPTAGDRVQITSEVSVTSSASLSEHVSRRQVDEIAADFAEHAERLGGDGTQVERLRQIESTMRDDWTLDQSAPGGGQQLALIERFIVDSNRGTREQFVTAYVLLARSLGVDARVAAGFVLPPDSVGSPVTITSEMAATWPEVRFDDHGWVAFDPVPQLEATDEDEQPPPPEAQTPSAAQPPIPPPTDEVDEVDDETVDVEAGADTWAAVRRVLLRTATIAAIGLLPFLAAIATIVGLKWRRRRVRRRHPDPARRIRGLWADATDSLVDAGLTIAPSWTDDTIALAGMPMAPSVPHEMRRLASMATQMTFGSTRRAGVLADDAVLTAEAVDRAIRAEQTRWQRVRWHLSLRSLRRRTRSPVGPDPRS